MNKPVNAEKMSIRKRRTGNLTQSVHVQTQQFLIRCHRKNLTKNTIDTYERHLGSFEGYLNDIAHTGLIMDVNRQHIEEYILKLLEVEHLNPNTINAALRHLKAFFNQMVDDGVLEKSPICKDHKLRVDEIPFKPFSETQIKLLLSGTDKSTFVGYRDFIIMNILLGTGMRISELASLKFKDIDLKEGSILIRNSKSRKARIVGIPKTLKAEIIRFTQLCYESTNEDEPVFQNIDGGQLCIRTIQQNISKYGENAGITGVRCSAHTFRRTFAINYLKNGGSTSSLRQQLGHSSLQIVERYLYWSDKDILLEHEKYNPVDKFKGFNE